MKLVLGIDTGGTYTDAVLYDVLEEKIVASGKALTTKENLSVGIGAAVDQIPAQRLGEAEAIALSTTLATNACVEDKGGRAKLIFIGADRNVVEETGAKYGLPPAAEIFFLDAVIHGDGEVETEPDWETFLCAVEPFLADADSVAIVSYQGIHNPVLEQKARELLKTHFGMFAVCGHELFWSLNYLKRGAGTLLNARLIPVITDFLAAIRASMRARGMDVPILIVRSDGTLMSEAFSRERPVETILCGPAASVMGGMTLAGCKDCLVADMGGTTTDIAFVRNGKPVKGTGGVRIGKWDTFVDSVYIHTFGLGGDSIVRLDSNGTITVGPQRVLPLCVAASRWESVRLDLEELEQAERISNHPLHEFLYLVRDLAEDAAYTDKERAICGALRAGPLRIDQLAQAVGSDLYTLDTRRLEAESHLMRCGFTPTDAMHLRGDFTRFDRAASQSAAVYLAKRLEITPEAFCEKVYEQVKKTLYLQIVRALLENEDKRFCAGLDSGLERVLEASWEQRESGAAFLRVQPCTPLTLVGIGASTHLFLPDVASVLGAACVIPENAAVANALGAVAGNISATVCAEICPEADGVHFCIFTPRQRLFADDYEQALQLAADTACAEAREEAVRRGVQGEVTLSWQETPFSVSTNLQAGGGEVCLSVRVTATAAGSAGF